LSKPIVAIVGRPNVGKSTLFNRIFGERLAITADEPGTTRDRIFANVEWDKRAFFLVDTAGLETRQQEQMAKAIRRQVDIAIQDADVIVFVTDAETGQTGADLDVADILRKSGKQVVLAVNKADSLRRELNVAEFYRFGLGDPIPTSALHNEGIGAILDRVVALLPEEAEAEEETEDLRLAIVGRPNVGKSSLLNALIGEERSVVSDVPGTTRDTIDTVAEIRGQKVRLLDTAGIRRRGKIEQGVEQFSLLRALRAIDRADIALLLLDTAELGSAQDTHIGGFVLDAGKGLVLVVNKWDLAKGLDISKEEVEAFLRPLFKFAPYTPIVYTSALRAEGLRQLVDTAFEVHQQRNLRIEDEDLMRIVLRAAGEHLPGIVGGRRRLNIFEARQVGVNPPTFVFQVNDPKLVHFSYERYLENRLRAMYAFTGTPLKFIYRRRGEK